MKIALIAALAALAGPVVAQTPATTSAPTPAPATAPPSTAAAAPAPHSPTVLPGRGLDQHPFVYAGEWDTRKDQQSIFVVKGGKIVWSYSLPRVPEPGRIQEFDDATMLANGDIIFSHMIGAAEVRPDKTLAWSYDAPRGTEIHSIQAIGPHKVLIMRNGTPAEAMIIDTRSGKILQEIVIHTPVTSPHGQFRHIRMTKAHTILVPHLGEGRVDEIDMQGNVIWSVAAKSPWQAVRLDNGDTLISGDWSKYVREVNPKGETVWEFTQADVPDITLFNTQTAQRLANGDTLISNWSAGDPHPEHWLDTVQFLEVSPDNKVVWALRAWTPPGDLGPATSIQLLDQPGRADRLGAER